MGNVTVQVGGQTRTLPYTVATSEWTPRFAGDLPPGSKYVGVSLDGTQTIAQFETRIGGPVGLNREYFQPTVASLAAAVKFCKDQFAAHRLPVISFKVPSGNWAAVARREQDPWVITVRDAIAGSTPGPKIVSFHHEPHGDGAAKDFRAMYDLALYPLFASVADRVTVAPILNGYFVTNPDAGQGPLEFCPDLAELCLYDAYMQWWTYDKTLKVNYSGAADTYRNPVPASAVFEIARIIIASGRVTGCVEWGVHQMWHPGDEGKAAQYIKDFEAEMFALDDFIMASAFQSAANSPRGGWAWHVEAHPESPLPPNPVYFPSTGRVEAAKSMFARTARTV